VGPVFGKKRVICGSLGVKALLKLGLWISGAQKSGSFSVPNQLLFGSRRGPFLVPKGPRMTGFRTQIVFGVYERLDAYSDVKEREGILPCVGRDLKGNVRFLELENRKCDDLGDFSI